MGPRSYAFLSHVVQQLGLCNVRSRSPAVRCRLRFGSRGASPLSVAIEKGERGTDSPLIKVFRDILSSETPHPDVTTEGQFGLLPSRPGRCPVRPVAALCVLSSALWRLHLGPFSSPRSPPRVLGTVGQSLGPLAGLFPPREIFASRNPSRRILVVSKVPNRVPPPTICNGRSSSPPPRILNSALFIAARTRVLKLHGCALHQGCPFIPRPREGPGLRCGMKRPIRSLHFGPLSFICFRVKPFALTVTQLLGIL